MKNNKGFITLALILCAIPGLSFADGTYYYGNQGYVNDAPPVRTQGVPIQNAPSTVYTIENPATIVSAWAPNIRIKSKAERDADRAALEADMARRAEESRVALNPDGAFAYGYTNGQGAQYQTDAKYVDARNVRGSSVAAAGFAAGSFLPTTFWGWVLVILLAAVLVAIARAYQRKFYSKRTHAHA